MHEEKEIDISHIRKNILKHVRVSPQQKLTYSDKMKKMLARVLYIVNNVYRIEVSSNLKLRREK